MKKNKKIKRVNKKEMKKIKGGGGGVKPTLCPVCNRKICICDSTSKL
ncbi:MAG TPA: hypothetical protein PK443_05550 [bacterium]|nr:hypothetical protein [bacterium]